MTRWGNLKQPDPATQLSWMTLGTPKPPPKLLGAAGIRIGLTLGERVGFQGQRVELAPVELVVPGGGAGAPLVLSAPLLDPREA